MTPLVTKPFKNVSRAIPAVSIMRGQNAFEIPRCIEKKKENPSSLGSTKSYLKQNLRTEKCIPWIYYFIIRSL